MKVKVAADCKRPVAFMTNLGTIPSLFGAPRALTR